MLVILDTWKAGIGRTEFRGQSGQTVCKTPSPKITRESQALVAQACNPSYAGGRDQEDFSLKPALVNSS
jgi:hypothetical protein